MQRFLTQTCLIQFQKIIPEVQIPLPAAAPNPIPVTVVQAAVTDRAVLVVTADVQAAAMVIASTVVKGPVIPAVTVIVIAAAREHAQDIVIITA